MFALEFKFVSMCVWLCACALVFECVCGCVFVFLCGCVGVCLCLLVCVCACVSVRDIYIYMRPAYPSHINYVTGGIIYIRSMGRNYLA